MFFEKANRIKVLEGRVKDGNLKLIEQAQELAKVRIALENEQYARTLDSSRFNDALEYEKAARAQDAARFTDSQLVKITEAVAGAITACKVAMSEERRARFFAYIQHELKAGL